MTLVNPRIKSAKTSWWQNVTSQSKGCEKVTKTFFVRREKQAVLANLVPKITDRHIVQNYRSELLTYAPYEESLIRVLKAFAKLLEPGRPENLSEIKQLFHNMMCLMSCMRAACIHAMLPGGREWTMKFSPTRRGLIRKESRPSVCVCCNCTMRPTVPLLQMNVDKKKWNKHTDSINPSIEEFEDGIDNDDDVSDYKVEKEELVPIRFPLCKSTSGLRHYAHAECHEKMKQEKTGCPRCLHREEVFKIEYPGCKRYCQNVDGGFPGSSKIDSVIQWQASVPKDDKVSSSSVYRFQLIVLYRSLFCNKRSNFALPIGTDRFVL